MDCEQIINLQPEGEETINLNPEGGETSLQIDNECLCVVPFEDRDYNKSFNKPQINGVTLEGDKTSEELKLASEQDLSDLADRVTDLEEQGGEPNVIETVKVNGTALTPDADKAVDVTVPTKTSDLTNDGDGSDNNSPFATEAYVEANGGKIDTIKVNGVAQTIEDKAVDIDVPTSADINGAISTALANSGNPYQTQSDVAGAIAGKANKATTLAGYGITDAYTKTEVDNKITGVYRYKGSVATVSALPANASVGDVYNVESDGMNYAWDGTKWDELGGSVDLTDYYTKTQTDTLLGGKADKSTTYTKSETDTLLNAKANQSTTYTKTEVDALIPDTSDFITKDVNNLTNYTTTTALNNLLDGKVNDTDVATDSTYGIVKTDSSQYITLNADGQLVIGGRLGQTEQGGLYSPVSMNPTLVDMNALLLSGMSGLSVGNGALALLRGAGVTVKSAPAGTTEYHVENTYLNRLKTVGLQYSGAVCIINEDAEQSGDYSNILSCTINGASFVPHTGPDDPNNDIVITVDKTCNPDSTVTQIRCYTAATKSSSFYAGQMVGAFSGLANVVVGQSAFSNTGNVVAMIAAQSYNNGNGNALFGRYHNSAKNRWLMSGTGHDNTNGRTESGAVVGQYSDIKPDTLFAVGDGVDQLHRSNAFEVTESGVSLPKVNNLEIVDVNLAPAINATNYSRSSTMTITDGVARFPDNVKALYLTKKSPAIPVTAGEVIDWSYEVRKTDDAVVCNQGLNLMKTNAPGGSATDNWVLDESAASYTTSWQTVSGTFTVPTGMEYMTPRLTKTVPTGATATTGAYEVRNLKITKPGSAALVMSSPNGTRFKITVDDSGNLTTTAL